MVGDAMTIRICDVCLRQPLGCELTSFVVGGQRFDVCGICEDSPFRVPRPAHAMVMLSPGSGVEVFVSNPGDPR